MKRVGLAAAIGIVAAIAALPQFTDGESVAVDDRARAQSRYQFVKLDLSVRH